MLLAAVESVHYAFMIPLILISVFLILLILVQRGRGGGLTGALGGMGGQSAFGTKAGDLFTRITIITAAIWVLLSMAALKVLNQRSAAGGLSSQRGTPTLPTTGTPAGGIPITPDKSKTEDKATPAPTDSKEPPTTRRSRQERSSRQRRQPPPAAESPAPSATPEPAKP